MLHLNTDSSYTRRLTVLIGATLVLVTLYVALLPRPLFAAAPAQDATATPEPTAAPAGGMDMMGKGMGMVSGLQRGKFHFMFLFF